MATPPPPPLSPTVATPLAHRKRRHSEINGSERPKVVKSPKGKRDGHQVPAKARLQVPDPRGRSSTPVRRDRSTTPSSSAKRPQVNSAVSPESRPKPYVKTNGSTPSRLNGAARAGASSPRPSIISRPSASPRPNVASGPSASPRPSIASGPSASPRFKDTVRPEASRHPSAAGRPSASPRPQQPPQRRIEDSDDEDEDAGSDIDKSDIEDILDSAELEPFSLATEEDSPDSLDALTIGSLKQRLLDAGPQEFLVETLDKAKMPPHVLGIVFGLDPNMYSALGSDIYMRILGQMVMRHYFKRQKLPQYNSLDDVGELLKKCSNIIVVAGAGISTSLGIPDFRSHGSGFYDRAMAKAQRIKFLLGEPEEVFDLEIFDERPDVFYTLAGDILPDENKFTPTHAFIKLLQDKGKLLTCYTQNIDNLERSAGITDDKLIQCHGSFATATCRRRGVKNEAHRVAGTDIFPSIRKGEVAYCQTCETELEQARAEKQQQKKQQDRRKKRSRFNLTPNKRTPTPSFGDDNDNSEDDDIAPGVMKPDITFFGEQLPNTFFERFTEKDCKVVDLVLVLGTSLKVAPVSEMPNYLPHKVPHVYVSREAIRHVEFDVQCLGDCDDVVVELCRKAGWDGADGRAVVQHEMVEAKDAEGRVIVVGAEEGDETGCKWRVRREELVV